MDSLNDDAHSNTTSASDFSTLDQQVRTFRSETLDDVKYFSQIKKENTVQRNPLTEIQCHLSELLCWNRKINSEIQNL